MSPFFKFTFSVTLVACVLAIAIVLLANRHSQRVQARLLAAERERARELFTDQAKKVRRADLVVESQQVSGTGKVIETTVIFRPWISTASEKDIELSLQRVKIPGDTVTIDGQIVNFSRNYLENVDFLASSAIPMFGHLYGEGQKPSPENLLAPSFSGPSPAEDPDSVSIYELRIWSSIREAMLDPVTAEKNGITIQLKTSASRVVRPGVAYAVWLGKALGVVIEEQPERTQIVRELLARAEAIDAWAATRPSALRN